MVPNTNLVWLQLPSGVMVHLIESPNAPSPDPVHVAFEVDDIEEALRGKTVLLSPDSPSTGVTAAMILDNGCPIELIMFRKARKQKPRAARRTTRRS